MPTRYFNGKKMKVLCRQCGAKVDATIYQQRIRWIAKLSCPHAKKHMGYTMPVDELKRKQLIAEDNSSKDPRVIAAQNAAREDNARRDRELREFYGREQNGFTRSKYL